MSSRSRFNFTTLIRFRERERERFLRRKKQFFRLEIMCFVRANVTEFEARRCLTESEMFYGTFYMHNMIWYEEKAKNFESCEK